MKVKGLGRKKTVETVNRLPKKWRNRFDASLIESKTVAKKTDAAWVIAFFSYGLN
jgi:hypothetical protein